MVRLGICDDDKKILEILRDMIYSQYKDQIQIYCFKSQAELLFWQEENPGISLDIMIIDIVLKKESGIVLAKKLYESCKKIKIIFITGYLEHAPEIFQVEPVYLLRKPISAIKLVEAIEKALDKLQGEEMEWITLHSRGGIFRLNRNYISYVELSDRKVLIHHDGESIGVPMKMDELAYLLGDSFLRCHHSYLVNMDFIRYFSSNEIEIMDGRKIPVSRPKSAGAKNRFLMYLGEKM